MTRRYVFPDIHGCIQTLQFTFEKIIRPDKSDHVYFTGDFINKGPDSKGVLDYVFSLIEQGYQVHAVRGNHEQLLLNALEDESKVNDFLVKGGLDTLESFSSASVTEIPEHYIRFMDELPYFIELEDYFIVHAGFNFAAPDPFKDLDSMLYIRDFSIDPATVNYKRIIHGHYALPLEEILYNLIERKSYALNIDNGCVYTHREGMGNLFVLNLDDLSYHIQPCLDEHNYEDSVSKRRYYKDNG